MEIEFEGRKSAPVSVPVAAATPAIFTISGGVGQAVVVNGATSKAISVVGYVSQRAEEREHNLPAMRVASKDCGNSRRHFRHDVWAMR